MKTSQNFCCPLLAACLLALASLPSAATAQTTLYGSAGSGGDNPGSIFTVNQTNGSGTFIGPAAAAAGLSGIAFNSSGQLYGSTVGGPPAGGPGTGGDPSNLVLIDPASGNVLSTIGVITFGSTAIKISDLAFQPGTGVLFALSASAGPTGSGAAGRLFTINLATAAATLIGNTGSGASGGIAFAPNGTLYETSYNNSVDFTSLNTLDPSNAARLATVPLDAFYDALAVRPDDGALFTSRGNSGSVYTINPATGATTLVGVTGLDSALSDLAFVPEPATWAIIVAGMLMLGGMRRVATMHKRRLNT